MCKQAEADIPSVGSHNRAKGDGGPDGWHRRVRKDGIARDHSRVRKDGIARDRGRRREGEETFLAPPDANLRPRSDPAPPLLSETISLKAQLAVTCV